MKTWWMPILRRSRRISNCIEFEPRKKENPAVPKVLRDLCFIMAKMCDKNTNLTYPEAVDVFLYKGSCYHI